VTEGLATGAATAPREGAVSAEQLREAATGPWAARLSPRYLEEHLLVPLGSDAGGGVVVAAGRPLDPTVTDELGRLFGSRVRVVQVSPSDVQAALLGARRHLEQDTEAGRATGEGVAPGDGDLGDLRARANDAPVIQLVNALLSDAMATGASDVHLESTRDGLRLRQRLDGVLRDVATYPLAVQAGVISRIKLLAGLDIAERRLPQDGRARARLGNRSVDIRVSTLPALHGESVVLRLLDHAGQSVGRDFSSLGMPPTVRPAVEALVRRNAGLFLVTGPTGSGKTTTLYAALASRNAPGVKIVTVEDPVEYQVSGVTQVPVNRKAGLGFANVLRSILRHDPDIVMVGELRDRETAEMAVQAALTGHLVLSTLHTSDAPGGITRLIDMGIEPYLVAATVQGIVAQRLVRLVCLDCAGPIAPDDPALAALVGSAGEPATPAVAAPFRRGAGCLACGGTGYRGRTGIYELFVPGDDVRRHLAATGFLPASSPAGEADARVSHRSGCVATLAASGIALARQGRTTPEEVRRVLSLDDSAAGEEAR